MYYPREYGNLSLGDVYVDKLSEALQENMQRVLETGNQRKDKFNMYKDQVGKWNIGLKRESNRDFQLSKKLSSLLRHNLDRHKNLKRLPGKLQCIIRVFIGILKFTELQYICLL